MKMNIKDEIKDKSLKSRGANKLRSYFSAIIKTEDFDNFIKNIREYYGIPKNGFKPTNSCYYFPPLEFIGIKSEKEKIAPNKSKEAINIKNNITSEIINKICERYKLDPLYFGGLIRDFVFYNEFVSSDGAEERSGLAIIEDSDKSEDLFPITIKISPYISQRDLVDFIKKLWTCKIKPLQDKYKDENIKIGKIKKKNASIQERNDFIYQNRNLSLNETKKLVKEKFGEDLDYEYVGKIRSEEDKKRKNV